MSHACLLQALSRVGGYQILVTKEMPVPAHVIDKLPDSGRLICEAGTGEILRWEAEQGPGRQVANTYAVQRLIHAWTSSAARLQ